MFTRLGNRLGLAVGVTTALVVTLMPVAAPTATAEDATNTAGAPTEPREQAAASSPTPPTACTTVQTPPSGLIPYDPTAPYSGPPLLLPAWADHAGWYQPDQYETILGGDIDGDGKGELLGRNAVGLETNTWATPFRKPGDPDAPTTVDQAPGQWTQLPVTGPAFPERATLAVAADDDQSVPGMVPGYFDPSLYSTFRLANIDKVAGDELIVRQPQYLPPTPNTNGAPLYNGEAMVAYKYVNGAWSTTPIVGPAWTNAPGANAFWGNNPTGWFNAPYYETISTGDINKNGQDEIIGRGPNGIESWTLNTAGTGFDRLDPNSTILTDAEGWAASPAQYSSIRVADFTGDGRADIAALATDQAPYAAQGAGLLLYEFNEAGGNWSWSGTIDSWIPANGWNNADQYGTITVGNINGDNKADIIGRGPNGLEAYTSEFDTGSGQQIWSPLIASPSALAGSTFEQAPYYSTIQAGNVLDSSGQYITDEVLARDTDGLHTLTYDPTTQSFSDLGIVLTQFSDANGWNTDAARYSTIKSVETTVGEPRAVIGRDTSGVRTYVLEPEVRPTQWISASTPFPAWSGGSDDTSLGDATDEGRSYNYINASVTSALYGDFAPPASIRSTYHELGTDMAQVAGLIPPTRPMSLNVPRSTYQAVEQDVTDWTNAVGYLRSFYFNPSGSLQQLFETSLLTASNNSYSVDTIETQFEPKDGDQFLALLGDMIWGAFGALDPESALLGAFFSFAGAGASAGLGFVNLDGKVELEASQLDNAIVNTFCQADAFLFGTHEQVVDDYGLLTAVAEMYGSGVIRFTDSNYPAAQRAANKARAVWIYQQFTGMHNNGWRAGYCRQGQDQCSMIGAHDAPSAAGVYFYQMITTDGSGTASCGHASGDAYATLTADPGLGVDPMDWTTQTEMFWNDGADFSDTWGAPITRQLNGNNVMGILGWHVITADCHT